MGEWGSLHGDGSSAPSIHHAYYQCPRWGTAILLVLVPQVLVPQLHAKPREVETACRRRDCLLTRANVEPLVGRSK